MSVNSTNFFHIPGHKRTRTDSNTQFSPILGSHTPQNPTPVRSNGPKFQQDARRANPRRDEAIDPALSEVANRPDRTQEQGYKDAVRAWARFRFVRAGWFTPSEAIDYID